MPEHEGAKLLLSGAALQEELEGRRKRLLEGIPTLSENRSVSGCQRFCLAVLRTIIFVAATIGLLWLQIWLSETNVETFRETAIHKTAVLGENGTIKDTSGDEACPVYVEMQDPWAYHLAQLGSLQINIVPHGRFTDDLPTIHWYASEEVYRNRDVYLLFSMGARGLNPAVVSMGLEEAMSTEKYMTALKAAFSRNLLNPLEQESVKGTMFVHATEGTQWVDGGWKDVGVSDDWLAISGLAFGLMLLLCFSVLKWIWKEINHDWKLNCDVWVAQHEYLWERAKRSKIFAVDSHTLTEAEMEAALAKKTPTEKDGSDDLELSFQDRVVMCSPFFVLDNFLANAYSCEEQVGLSVASAILHAVAFCAVCLLPSYACCLMPAWGPSFHVMASAYGLCIILLGAFYYLSFGNITVRFALSVLQIACLAFWTVLTVAYLVSAIIYLSAISAVNEDLIPNALSPLATIVAYVAVITVRLKDLQQHYMEILKGKKSKGFIISQIQRLGFSTGEIVILVLEGVAALLGLLILQLRVRNAYAGPGMHGNLLSSAILPSYAVVHSVVQLRKSSDSDAASNVDEVTGAITDIF
ncbi:kmo [Symbiodinium sp. CCMP2592]|nr:kmo [Symbiodinium sp. CCMP2592]